MSENKKEYYLNGLDCADCARKFGLAVAKLNGVKKAEVIFAANKLVVWGEPNIAELTELALAHSIKISVSAAAKQEGSILPKIYLPVIIGFLTLVLGIFLPFPYGEIMLVLTVVVGGSTTFVKAFNSLLRFKFDMSVLMALAVTGALFIGEWREAALVAWLFAVSHWLEHYTAAKARNSLQSLMEKVPEQALLIKEDANVLVPVYNIAVGDKILVRAGEKIPLDGVVAEGSSQVNQAAVTGESVPVAKNQGDKVFGGSLNEMGALTVEVTHIASESTMAKIVRLVEEAQNKQSKSQTFIERFAAYYTPVVMALALLVAVLPPILFNGGWHGWIYNGLSLLVVACPCALVITTPVVLVASMSNAAGNGIIIKGGAELEALSRIKQIAFDKTGTLTHGVHKVEAVLSLDDSISHAEILSLAAAVEQNSIHPLALSILEEAKSEGLSLPAVTDFIMHNAAGVEALVAGKKVWVGKLRNPLSKAGSKLWQNLQNGGNTIIAVEIDSKTVGMIALADTMRSDALAAVAKLKQRGIAKTVMLTGDNSAVAENIAKKAGIEYWQAELLPEDKLKYIKELQNHAPVMMVGDGINDAPALAVADIGLAMGVAGSDTALEVADVALMADDLTKIPYALDLSKKAVRIIKQNIIFAIGLKLLVLFTIFPGWLSLWLAILADMGANILVTLNGMRLVSLKKANASNKAKACNGCACSACGGANEKA
ncbi:MAG: cation-translocating P-type ATPase [Clostridia bacterium]|nr:cation-translocating P-type ATPase [Clostridia bacterium]